MKIVVGFLESLSPLNHILNRMSIPIRSIGSFSFKLLSHVHESVFVLFPLEDFGLGFIKIVAHSNNLMNKLLSHGAYFVLELLLAISFRIDLLFHINCF